MIEPKVMGDRELEIIENGFGTFTGTVRPPKPENPVAIKLFAHAKALQLVVDTAVPIDDMCRDNAYTAPEILIPALSPLIRKLCVEVDAYQKELANAEK